jgi:hypothetical protein
VGGKNFPTKSSAGKKKNWGKKIKSQKTNLKTLKGAYLGILYISLLEFNILNRVRQLIRVV